MANKKISELSATTQANDNVFLVMNNSGNTETFRIKRSDLLSGTSTPQTIEISGFTDTNGNNFTTTNDVFPSQPNTFDTSVAGRGFINYGFDNSVGSNAYIFGSNNTTGNFLEFGGMVIGDNNTYTTDGMIFGRNNTTGRGLIIGVNNSGSGNNLRSTTIGFNNNSGNGFNHGVFGNFNTLNNVTGSFILGNSNSVSASSSLVLGFNHNQTQTAAQYSTILGGVNNDITSTGTHNTIVGGQDNLLSGTTSGTTLIGLQNFTSPTNDNTTYVDKLYVVSDEIKTTSTSVLLGGSNNIKGTNTSFGVIGGSNNNATNRGGVVFSNNTTSGVDGFVFGAQNVSNTIGNSPTRPNVVIGGKYHSINTNFSSYNGLFAGVSNKIYSNQNTPHYGNYHIIGGSNNLIGKGTNASPVKTSNANFGSIINSYYGQIEEGDFNTIIGSNNVNISGLTGTTIIGLENFTATENNTTYVDNSHTLRTETFDTISGGSVSGVVSVDLSQGTLYKFSITGNITSVDFINWREGQRAEFIVENTGSYTISAMTISGGGSVYVQGGSVNPTNNAFTKYRGVIVDGDMFLNEELNFQPFV